METGYLTIQVLTGDNSLPVGDAQVIIKNSEGKTFYKTYTNLNGNTDYVPLFAPNKIYSMNPNYPYPAYSTYDVSIYADGFYNKHIHGVQILDTQITILPVSLHPLQAEIPITNRELPKEDDIYIPPNNLLIPSEILQIGSSNVNTLSIAMVDEDIYIPPNSLLIPTENLQIGLNESIALRTVIIPDYITVHLGIPTNVEARNVRVAFSDYIKNVASHEIYSTWPYNALVANIHVIVTFAINRVYSEWYRSRGFNFDITNSTAFDQMYVDGGQIFQNISEIVDNIFNIYARRIGFKNPFFTQYCNGTTVTCNGLSQWGTVSLANQGLDSLQILRYYYPDDLELVASDNITGITESFPGYELSIGSQGEPVLRMQNYLNRIRANFPLIPVIFAPNGYFDTETQTAVRTFQNTFHLTADGIIGRATWNKISFTYVGVIRLGELDSEGIRIGIGINPPDVVLSLGSTGSDVIELQFIIDYTSPFYPTIPTVIKDGIFGSHTQNAVIEFQKTFGLVDDGVVGVSTWNKLYEVFRGINQNAPIPSVILSPPTGVAPYPGVPLSLGSVGPNVRLMESYLNTIRIVYTSIPFTIVNGIFDEGTRISVVAFQQEFLLTPDGVIGPITWNKIIEQYLLVTGQMSVSLQYPGTPLEVGSTGSNVSLMQGFLSELRVPYPSLPPVTVDGIFSTQTEAAVTVFQRLLNLTPNGIIGPATWYAIINERNARV